MKEWILRYAEQGSDDDEEKEADPVKDTEVEEFDPVSVIDFTNASFTTRGFQSILSIQIWIYREILQLPGNYS